MTGRGAPPVYLPGPDPSLKIRPVPQERHYNVRSFGPGTAPDVRQSVRSLEQLDQEIKDAGIENLPYDVDAGIRQTLDRLTDDCNTEYLQDGQWVNDPTWGPCIVVTAYSEEARQNLDKAISNLVETFRRYFFGCVDSPFHPYARDAFTRLKFDLIENKEWLETASDDRVREEFNAYIRSLHLDFGDDSEDKRRMARGLNRPSGFVRFHACVVFDETLIERLAALCFPEALHQDRGALKDVSVKLVDRNWDYPEQANEELSHGLGKDRKPYTGTDICSIPDLPVVWAGLRYTAGLDELVPLSRYIYNHTP